MSKREEDRATCRSQTELEKAAASGLRQVLDRVVPQERREATPLYLILDDISGVSLVAGWAWSQWDPHWLSNARAALKDFDLDKAFASRVGICSGFAPGSSGFDPTVDRSGTPLPGVTVVVPSA